MKMCYKCNTSKPETEFHKNRVKKDGLATQCKSCKKETNRIWLENNRQVRRDYRKHKRETDPLFKLKDNLRSRARSMFYNMKINKFTKTESLLGGSYKEAKKHIEEQFSEGMSWDNYGKWHIDHIIPLALAETKEQSIMLFHYKNTQPLWAEDNERKGSKII